MQTSTQALLSLVILVFLIPSGLLADEDSLFSIQDSAVVGTDVTERFLASHYVKKFTIVTIDTNRLREEIRTASLIRNTGDAHPLAGQVPRKGIIHVRIGRNDSGIDSTEPTQHMGKRRAVGRRAPSR